MSTGVTEAQRARRSLPRVRSALALSSLAALSLAWTDFYVLRGFSVPFWEAVGASAATSLFIAVASLPLAWMTALLVGPPTRRLATSLWEQPTRVGPRYFTIGAAITSLGGATYGGLLFAQAQFASAAVHRVALTCIVVGTAICIALVATPFEQWLERRLTARSRQATRVGVVGAAVALPAAATVAIFLAAQPVLQELELRPAASCLGVGVAALAGYLLPAASTARIRLRRIESALLWLGTALGVVLVVVAGWFATQSPSPRLRLAVQLRPTANSWVLRSLDEPGAAMPPPATPARDRSAVCWTDSESPPASVGRVGSEAPDILLVTVDAIRWDHTSLSGYERDTTPLLATRAKNAVVFERAYATASSTRQSVRGLFTGVYSSLVFNVRPSELMWGMGFTSAQITWAEYLRDAGYETIAYSSQDSVFSRRNGALDGFQEVDESAVEVRRERGHTADYIVDLVLARLSKPRSNPRFLWAHLMEPHKPYPAGPKPVHYGDEPIDAYDSAIHYADTQLDRLLERTLSENTWVFVTADHGEAFREHGYRHHGKNVYDEEIHVPLLFWGPGIVPRRITTPVSLIDLLPTALDVAGLSPPEALCGESLRPVLEGAPPTARVVYAENVPDHARAYFSAALIQGDRKLVLRPMAGIREVYDLMADPQELDDLSQARPAELAELMDTVREFYRARGLNPASYGL